MRGIIGADGPSERKARSVNPGDLSSHVLLTQLARMRSIVDNFTAHIATGRCAARQWLRLPAVEGQL